MMSPDEIIVLDSSRNLSQSEVYSLFANCGEITSIVPFSLPPKCLRDFPGLSQYFVEFADENAARRAAEVYLPADVKVDLLPIVPELVPLFVSLRARKDVQARNHHSPFKTRRRTGRQLRKKGTHYEHLVVVCCKQEQDESDIKSAFSTCGEIKNIHAWESTKYRKRRFFLEFANATDVERVQKGDFPGLDVLCLAQNTAWVKHYKKVRRWGAFYACIAGRKEVDVRSPELPIAQSIVLHDI